TSKMRTRLRISVREGFI
nr:immunoglobulin heavy chain junction region [Mus musculus]